MEEVIQSRLRLLVENIESLTNSGQDILSKLKDDSVDLDDAQLITSKLESSISRFVTEMYNYYKIAETPSADDMARFTATQIKGEELVTELVFRVQKKIQSRSDSSPKTNSSLNVTSKLPKMELARFNGDVLKWHQFWDQFVSNVDSRNINEVDKLLYLQSVLEGEAKRAIEGLDTTNKNYQIAVSTLKERYGKPGTIIDAHYAALYRIKTADKSVEDIRRVFNEIERHLRVLGSLGEDVNHNHLRVLIMQKFSEDLVYELRMKLGTEIDSIENIRRHLEHIISAREASSRMKEEIFQSNQPTTSKSDTEKFTLETFHVGSYHHRNQPQLSNRPTSFSQKKDYREFKGNRRDSLRRGDKFHSDNKYTRREFNLGKRQHPRSDRETDMKRKRPTCVFCGNGHFNDECDVVKTVVERKKLLMGKCYNCFSKGHKSRACKSLRECRHCKKYGEHNRALCPSKDPVKTDTMHVNIQNNNKLFTVLQTAIVKINKIGSRSVTKTCRALLDCGSQRTYITKRLSKQLNLPELERTNLCVFTFGSEHPSEIESPLVTLEIATKTGGYKKVHANVVPHITNSIQTLPNDTIEQVRRLQNVPSNIVLADDASLGDQIDILIGNDYYFSLINNAKIQLTEGLYLVDSVFGWVWSGRCLLESEQVTDKLSVLTYFQSSTDCSSFCEPDLPLRKDSMRELWDLESIGITDSPKASRDDEAIKHFNKTTQYYDNRYHVKWPWTDYPPVLPSNFGLAAGRLNSLLKRLDGATLQSYDRIIKEQLDNGIIEVVPDIRCTPNHPVHYLPHHCVSQGDKLRLVYDASAKVKGYKSLNECLYRGPLMLEDLAGLLIRFREHHVALVADVEKAFLQIGLQNEDRDVTRFLWPKSLDGKLSHDNLIQFRFCRVPFGVISSPFLLNATIRYHLKRNNNPVYKQIAEDLYVDNLITSVESVEQAVKLYNASKSAFEDLSMNLREWNSNSDQFMKIIPTKYRSSQSDQMKVLGLNWNLKDDTMNLRFNIQDQNIDQVDTKREILRLAASVFDPCGFVVPLMLPIKLFLQELWHRKVEWDTKLSEATLDECRKAIGGLSRVKSVSVPRCYTESLCMGAENTSHELHAFTDASLQAYAAAVYLRSTSGTNTEISFVMGKSRLVNKEDQTDIQIPKLELLGVLIGNRLIQTIRKFLRLKITRLYLWTDSQIVLSWCQTNKLLPPFISKRVEEIKRNVDLNIRYVPSMENPADVATRPNASSSEVERWIKGADFLYLEHSKWPLNILQFSEVCALVPDVPAGQGPSDACSKGQVQTEFQAEGNTLQGDTISSFSDTDKCIGNHLDEIRLAQSESFQKELDGKKTDLVNSLGVYKDKNGLLRCRGRLGNTHWPDDQKFPILLPRNHATTSKIIMETHRQNYHVGVSHTLSLVRKAYWIPQGRMQVQKVLRQCQICKKYSGGPFRLPAMPSLPTERVTYSAPFTYVGLDYFGPVLVDVKGSTEKCWISLFTCLAVRAIHMEVVGDLTAEECSMALRRFISVRGIPKIVISDNALQFKLLANVLSNEYCIKNGIRWKFIPELAPWFGGFYERLIGIVKNCLKRTVDKHRLNITQFKTVIKEIEAVVNSRPLTTVGQELEHVLSPADFLRNGGPLLPEVSEAEFLEPATVTKTNLIEGWKRGQQILKEYVNMFSNQYLSSLRDRKSVHRQPRSVVDSVPKVGEIVQIKADSNRALWKVGKISAVIKSTDGKIRVAKVTISPNETLTRSIGHLYPLELEDNNDTAESDRILNPLKEPTSPSLLEQTPSVEPNSQTPDQTQITSRIDPLVDSAQAIDNHPPSSPPVGDTQGRPRRLAAQKARTKIQEWTSQLYVNLQLD